MILVFFAQIDAFVVAIGNREEVIIAVPLLPSTDVSENSLTGTKSLSRLTDANKYPFRIGNVNLSEPIVGCIDAWHCGKMD